MPNDFEAMKEAVFVQRKCIDEIKEILKSKGKYDTIRLRNLKWNPKVKAKQDLAQVIKSELKEQQKILSDIKTSLKADLKPLQAELEYQKLQQNPAFKFLVEL